MSKTSLQTILEELVEDGKLEDCTVQSYSGRAMYGRRCLGVVFGRNANVQATAIGAMVMQAYIFQAMDDADPDDPDASFNKMRRGMDEIVYQLLDERSDAMGLGSIVYWPMVEYVEDDSDEEEE